MLALCECLWVECEGAPGVRKGRQAAFSHWMGLHSSRALHLQERQGQNEVWLVKGNAGSCVNMHKKILAGPQSGHLTVRNYNGFCFPGSKTKQAVNKMWTEFGELKQAFFKRVVHFYLGKVKGLLPFLGRKFCFPKGKFQTGTGSVSKEKRGRGEAPGDADEKLPGIFQLRPHSRCRSWYLNKCAVSCHC